MDGRVILAFAAGVAAYWAWQKYRAGTLTLPFGKK